MARRTPHEIATDLFVRQVIAAGDHYHVSSEDTIRREMLEMVSEAIDEKLRTLKEGQALGIVFRIEVINRDGRLLTEPSARFSPEAAEWREAIFQRDAFTCQDCGRRGNLNAHHLDSWAGHPARRYDLDNGVTLCIDCHAARHPKRANLIRKAKYHTPEEK